MVLNYNSIHDKTGAYEGGFYSDYVRMINKGKTPYCSSCGTRLKFKLIREDSENLKPNR